LGLLDPRLVLQRGYAWLSDAQGRPLVRAAQARAGQTVQASLADGQLSLQVLSVPSAAGGAGPSPD
jgi:exodeoxyribonuclease VII large subunit